MKQTFKRGVRVPHNKLTKDAGIAILPAPAKVFIPLAQHIGKPATAVVAVGEKVKAGTRIGVAEGLGADIFASVSGFVRAVERRHTPTGACDHVVIENDGNDDKAVLNEVTELTAENIIARIKEAGIVGMGGAGFPTHVKLSPKTPVDTFILNAAECEPYITCDHRLLVEQTKRVVKGGELMARALGLDRFYIGIEDNKHECIEKLKGVADDCGVRCDIVELKSKYPQGAEKQLIYAVTKRKVPVGGLPASVGVVVDNVHTAYSVYKAVCEGEPLYRRVMTVTGAVARPGNLVVRTGTLFSECATYCGGAGESIKILSGGPMMGFAVDGLDHAVTKTTGALLFLDSSAVRIEPPRPCINCASCARACPMELMPMYIDAYTLKGDYATALRYGAKNCIECGCCSYVCPAKRPLVQSIRLCKRKLRELGL